MNAVNTFSQLDLLPNLQKAVSNEGYVEPTPIQAQAIPHLLEGKDLLGVAQTGTGKTAAFALPILHLLSETRGRRGSIRGLVLTPTRELAAQIQDSFATYGTHTQLRSTVIFGGVKQHGQEQALKRRPEILVATPGRLLDLMQQGIVRLDDLEIFVLDEADRMLDMGFIHDVRKVIAVLPEKRQSLFFSATMPRDVAKLADTLLTDPVRVEVTPQATTVERIEQAVMFVDRAAKKKLLEDVLDDDSITRALVFTRTKHVANRIATQLERRKISADAIHGNKSQNARTRALDGFRSGDIRVLVATDIAARGIDVEGVSHVINFELPNEPESYVHRIGRTARAGNEGQAISFCSGDERAYLDDIERLIRQRISVISDHPLHSDDAARGLVDGAPAEKPQRGGGRGRQDRGDRATSGRRVGSRGRHGSAQARSKTGASSSSERPAQAKSQPRASAPSGDGGAPRRRRRRGGRGRGAANTSAGGNS